MVKARIARLLLRLPVRLIDIVRRVAINTFNDGFVHAGNLAYMSLLTLFPFFIVTASIAGALGRTDDGLAAVQNFLATLPPDVAQLIAKPIADVLSKRGGEGLLTFGIVVGLWTTASYIETMRDILRRAYHARLPRPFWHYRLGSFAVIIGSVILMMLAFAAQVLITGAEQFVAQIIPFADHALGVLGLSRLAPVVILFCSLYVLFVTLTPGAYRKDCPKWPGAALTTAVWIGTTMLLPGVLGRLANYSLTYGSLAGVMIALLFFFVVGLGFVLGAELNAALAVIPKTRQKGAEPDNTE